MNFLRPVRTAAITILIIGAAFLAVGAISFVRTWSLPVGQISPNQINVAGKGEVFAVPDVATFTFTVNEEGKTIKDAQDKAAKKNNAAIAYLKKSGVDEKDIKTLSYNANPKYEYQQNVCITINCPPGKQVLTGYEVSETIQVKVRETDQAGAILSGIGVLKVQYVSGLQFTIDDEDAINAQAREKAIADAKAKAQVLAKDLGVRLVRIVSFYDDQAGLPYYANDMTMAAGKAVSAVAPEVPSGENKYTSNITLVYEIK